MQLAAHDHPEACGIFNQLANEDDARLNQESLARVRREGSPRPEQGSVELADLSPRNSPRAQRAALMSRSSADGQFV